MLPSKNEFIGASNILEELQAEIAEHELDKQKLWQRDSELAGVLKLIPDTYFRLDAEGMILDYKLGETEPRDSLPEIIPGRPLLEYLPQHIRGEFHQAIAQARQTQSTVNLTYNLSLPNRICTCEARLLSLQAQQIIVLIREIKQSQEIEFLDGKINLQTILQNENNIIYVLTKEGRFSYVSPNWTKILGHELSQVVGQSFVPFIHPDDVPHCLDYLSNIVNIGQNQEAIEYRVKHQDGSWRWHTSNATTIKDANGNVLYCLGIAHDITTRKLTEAALAQKIKLANFRAEVDRCLTQSSSLQEMMHGCTEAIVQHLNAAFARIWTLNKQENVLELQVSSGMYTHINGPHRLVPVGQFKIGLIAKEGKPHLTNCVQTDPRVGNKEWAKKEGMVAFAGYPLIVEGETLGVIATFSRQALSDSAFERLGIVAYEIAIGIKRKQTEEALRESEAKFRDAAKTAQEKAQQLEAALFALQQTQVQLIHTEKMSSLGQLVAGIAHEINNPVNFIYGNINHARKYVRDLLDLVKLYQQHYCPPVPEIDEHIYAIDLDFLNQDLPKLLDSINLGAERIRHIVLTLRNFSRLDEEGMKPVNIHEGIDSTLLLLQNRFKPKTGSSHIKVIKEYGNLPKIVCHAGQINQVFMNLLTNAIDALEESTVNSQPSTVNHPELLIQPQILIQTELTANQQAIIRIVDNGPGMTEEVRNRLFDPFFTTKPIGKGTGMGLSVSYQIIVNKHQGKLECISAPGKGAEFIITLPC